MVALQFLDDDAWLNCGDLAHMRRRFGRSASRRISHRLQQLAAMSSIEDLQFLPFEHRAVGRHIEVTVNAELVLLIETTTPTRRTNAMNETTITICAVAATPATVK